MSRTTDGEYLSSVDVELLLTLAGYVGIAIENADAVPLPAAQGRRVRAAEGIQREHRRVDQRRHPGGGPGRPRRELEHADRAAQRGHARACAGPQAFANCSPASWSTSSTGCAARPASTTSTSSCSSRPPPAAAANGNGNGNGNGHVHDVPARFREATLNIAIAPLVSKDQEQIGRLIIFDDVTDRAELEQRLVQADKLSSIGLLAAGVAHEVNTPLAVISTYAQMLAKQVAEDSQKSMILDKIAKQTFRASEIVNSLLNFSRTSTTSFGDVSLNRVIQETLSLLEHQLHKAGIQLKTDLDPDLPPVHGNAGKLQQVFLNLFLNARDAMGAGRHPRSPYLGRRLGRARGSVRYRPRHRAREHPPHLRSVLHHQGRPQGHGPRAFGDVRYHSRAWWLDRSLQPAQRRRHASVWNFPSPSPAPARKPVNAA